MFNGIGLVLPVCKKIASLVTSVHLATSQTFQTNFAILDLLYNAAIGVVCHATDASVF